MAIHTRAAGELRLLRAQVGVSSISFRILADLVVRRGFGQGRRIHGSLLVTTQIHRTIGDNGTGGSEVDYQV